MDNPAPRATSRQANLAAIAALRDEAAEIEAWAMQLAAAVSHLARKATFCIGNAIADLDGSPITDAIPSPDPQSQLRIIVAPVTLSTVARINAAIESLRQTQGPISTDTAMAQILETGLATLEREQTP